MLLAYEQEGFASAILCQVQEKIGGGRPDNWEKE